MRPWVCLLSCHLSTMFLPRTPPSCQTPRLQARGGTLARTLGPHLVDTIPGPPSRSTFPRVTPDRGTRQPTAALWADCGLCSAPHSPPSLQRHGQQPSRAGTWPGGQRGPTLDPHVLPPGTVFPAVPPSVSGTISKECCVVHSPPSGRMSCFSVTLPRRRSRQVK